MKFTLNSNFIIMKQIWMSNFIYWNLVLAIVTMILRNMQFVTANGWSKQSFECSCMQIHSQSVRCTPIRSTSKKTDELKHWANKNQNRSVTERNK
jgi:hypothetical protein